MSTASGCRRWLVVLGNFAKFTGKHLCQSLVFYKVTGLTYRYRCFPVNFVKFFSLSSEFCEISKSTFSYRTPPVAASVVDKVFDLVNLLLATYQMKNWKKLTILHRIKCIFRSVMCIVHYVMLAFYFRY